MYAIIIKPKAQKRLHSLSKKDQKKIATLIDILKEKPLAGKQLEGKYEGFHSLRAWLYRIIYMVDHKIITVTVVKIEHRKDAYR